MSGNLFIPTRNSAHRPQSEGRLAVEMTRHKAQSCAGNQHGPDKSSFLTCGTADGTLTALWLYDVVYEVSFVFLRSCPVPSASSWASTRTRAARSQQTTDQLRPADQHRDQTSAPTDTSEKTALSRAAKLPSYHSEQRLTRVSRGGCKKDCRLFRILFL